MRKKSRKMETEIEDYETFYQKQLLPKELRNINPNLLKLIPRATGTGMAPTDNKNFESKREITEEEKKLISMKYTIKRLNTIHNKEMLSFKKIKNKYSKKKTFMSDTNVSRVGENEEVSNCDSITKTSASPKKNERYSKVVVNEDEMDDTASPVFHKALSMPLNFTRVNEPKSADPNGCQGIDILLSELKIDEIEEDKDSVEDSSSDSNSVTKRQSDWRSKKNVSEK